MLAGNSLLSSLYDQTDQSLLFMFMDEMVLNHTVDVSVDILKACQCCLRLKIKSVDSNLFQTDFC